MAEIYLSERARADLSEIRNYSIDTFGDEVARRYMLAFEKALDQLALHPRSAPQLEVVRPPVRSLNCGSHRILHDIDGEVVIVLRVVHFARDVRKVLDDV